MPQMRWISTAYLALASTVQMLTYWHTQFMLALFRPLCIYSASCEISDLCFRSRSPFHCVGRPSSACCMPCAFSTQSFRCRKWHGLGGGDGDLHLGRFFLQVPTPHGVYSRLGGGFKRAHCHPILGILIQLEEHMFSNGWLYYSTTT